MKLHLILDEVPKDSRISFCKYIKKELEILFEKSYDINKTIYLENYLNSYNIIDQIIPKKIHYYVHDIYRLVFANLNIKKLNDDTYEITIDNNALIPNSYTKLSTILSLLEFGTLSVKKYGLLNDCMNAIAQNLTKYYIKYLGAK